MRYSIGTLGTNRNGRTTTLLRASKIVSLALIPILITACTASAGAVTSGGAEGAGDVQPAAQRIAFVQEEHGYTPDALTVTPEQRIAFQLEEHGYDVKSLLP
jgi:hypothetical protein